MTKEDHKSLCSSDGFEEFISACFLSATVIFIGVSADDVAAGGLLSNLKEKVGVSKLSNHYWISDRNDADSFSFADSAGIERIYYSSKNSHEELTLILEDLQPKKFELSEPDAILPPGKKKRGFNWPSLEELLEIKDTNELRERLNDIATQILSTGSPNRAKEYEDFLEKYEMAIARSWFIPKSGEADFFDYKLERLIKGTGAFGRVYEAKGPDGDSYAVKVIHNSVHDDPRMLSAFRRGVSSMRIVDKREVPGVVSIKGAWEMPTSIVMDFVPGMNLEEAVKYKQLTDWGERLTIFYCLAQVLLRAHRLPEIVIHRDVRPPNVILKDFYTHGDEIEVSLVDFDLSWHRDAFGKSVQQTPGLHGYFAPEQYSEETDASSRNALVDSFGLAMTMYFVVTGKHPVFGAEERANWKNEIDSWNQVFPCIELKSIPTRLGRLVVRGSHPVQNKRADMTTMVRELDWLYSFFQEDKIKDIRLLIEEVCHRSLKFRGNYEWDEMEGFALYESPSGLRISVSRVNADGVHIKAEWKNLGSSPYQSVKKYFERAQDRIKTGMSSRDWKCEIEGNFDGIRVDAEKVLNLKIVHTKQIDRIAEDIDFLINELSFS